MTSWDPVANYACELEVWYRKKLFYLGFIFHTSAIHVYICGFSFFPKEFETYSPLITHISYYDCVGYGCSYYCTSRTRRGLGVIVCTTRLNLQISTFCRLKIASLQVKTICAEPLVRSGWYRFCKVSVTLFDGDDNVTSSIYIIVKWAESKTQQSVNGRVQKVSQIWSNY